jgi:polar amino acid transport system substrate-binding protein
MFLRFFKTIATLLVLISISGMVQARSLDEILKSGVLKGGVNPGLPPLAKYDDKNNLVGFDADIMAKLAEMLGVKLELVKVGSPDRIPFVATGKIDVVMGALTRNYKRQKIVDYTVPVHTEVFGALTTSKKPFAAVMDMNRDDVKLAQVRGSMPAGWAKKNLTKAKITLFDNYPDAMRAIAQGRADAIVDVVDFLGEHMNKYKDVKWQVVDKAIDTWYCGIGVKKGNASLQQWLNVALYTLHRADFVDETWEKWFGIRQIHSVQPQPYF